MNSDDSNSIKRENRQDNEDSDPIKSISDETLDDDKHPIKINENRKFTGYGKSRNKEKNRGELFQIASNTHTSDLVSRSSMNPKSKKSEIHNIRDIRAEHIKEIINDEVDDSMVGRNGESPDEDNIYYVDDQIDLNGDDIALLDKKSDCFKNFESKSQIKKNQFFIENGNRPVTSKRDDSSLVREKNRNNSITGDCEVYDDDEELKMTNESKPSMSNFNFDVYSNETEYVTNSSSKWEPMVKFVNEKSNLKILRKNDILANHIASNKDECDKGNSSDSKYIGNIENQGLNNGSDPKYNDSYDYWIQEESLGNLPSHNIVNDRESLRGPRCSRERSPLKKIADNSLPSKVTPSKYFEHKWNTFNTKRKQFSKDFKRKIKKVSLNFKYKNTIDAELYDEDNVVVRETEFYDGDYYDENEDEKEENEEDKYQNDSHSMKHSYSEEVLIPEKNFLYHKLLRFQSSFPYLNKQMKITKSLNLVDEGHNLCHIEQNGSQPVCATDKKIENSQSKSVEKLENKNITKAIKKVKDIWKLKSKSDFLHAKRTSLKWYSLEDISRENKGKDLEDDSDKRMTVTTFQKHANPSEFKKTEDVHEKHFGEVHVENEERGLNSICLNPDDLNNIQNNYPLGMITLFKDSIEDLLDKKIELLMETWQEKASLFYCKLKSEDQSQIEYSVTSRKENDKTIETINTERNEKKASAFTISRSDSFPVIKKRYNLQMCLEYFDTSRDIEDIKTEILDSGQQMVHITLGESGRNLTLEKDIEAIFRTNSKVKTFSDNDFKYYKEAKSTEIYEDGEKNKSFNGENIKKRIQNAKRIFSDYRGKNVSEDNFRTSKQISLKGCNNGAVDPLNIPTKIPIQNKLSTLDMDSKYPREFDRDFDCGYFGRDQNRIRTDKTSLSILDKTDV